MSQVEIDKFRSMADRWWDPDGPMAPLIAANPTRLGYIKRQICDHYDRNSDGLAPLKGLTGLDIGCGAGLITEPMTRLGAKMTGIDLDDQIIQAAEQHAHQSGLNIDYRQIPAGDMDEKFDIVLALEVIEHVNNPVEFVRDVMARVKPGGIIIFSTLNKTWKSYLFAIIGAEYILNWLEKGTHDWQKFIPPARLAGMVRDTGGQVTDTCGMVYHPLRGEFSLNPRDLTINYFLTAIRQN
jgi:2-polyprenyl-6-hydroxyphenyl methylase/3-demethylubiquinone-9 3-methyltransferase